MKPHITKVKQARPGSPIWLCKLGSSLVGVGSNPRLAYDCWRIVNHMTMERVWVCPGCGHQLTDKEYKRISFDFRCGSVRSGRGCYYRLSKYRSIPVHHPVTPGEATGGSGEPA